MIVISAGMQKSGSAYFYNLLNDLLVAAGEQDARTVKDQYNLDGQMQWANNNIGQPRFIKLLRLHMIRRKTGSFAVKTHAGPNWVTRLFSALGAVKIIYIFRDPRDALLSAVDHGQKILNEGETHTFAKFASFEKALPVVKKWSRTWRRYHNMGDVLVVRYEDLMANPEEVMQSCESFLGISVSDKARKQIIWKYDRRNKAAKKKALHFNKAVTARWKTEMSREQKIRCNHEFGKYLVQMGFKRY